MVVVALLVLVLMLVLLMLLLVDLDSIFSLPLPLLLNLSLSSRMVEPDIWIGERPRWLTTVASTLTTCRRLVCIRP